MTRIARWCVVAALAIAVIGAPLVVRALPTEDEAISATALLERVDAARDAPYEGYVETRGSLDLPVADRFTDVGALLGEQTRLRVWWRDAEDWRVDKLLVSGETDLVHDAGRTTQWSYERGEAEVSVDPDIRLPRTADLLPPVLAARLLQGAVASDVERLPARSVAGHDTLGLRLEPSDPRSSIGRVDVWADRETAIPLLVEVYGDVDDVPALTSQFREVVTDEPSAGSTGFTAPPGADVSFEDVLDIADAANQYAPFRPPSTVAGLEATAATDGAVGVYGGGATRLIAIPLRGREGGPLREQLGVTLGRRLVPEGTVLSVGPLGVLLTGQGDDGGWLVAGTVTEETLAAAARDLVSGTVVLEDDR